MLPWLRISDLTVLSAIGHGQKGNFLTLYLQGKPGPAAHLARGHTCHMDCGGAWEGLANTLELCFEISKVGAPGWLSP